MKKGALFSFEGLDGSGKSTQISSLADLLGKQGWEVIVLREPGGTPISERIRELLLDVNLDEMDDLAELLLYEASRAQLVAEVIRPALTEGKIVILDRYYDSSTAYQGYGRGLDLSLLEELHRVVPCGVEPLLTFFIDVPPVESLGRLQGELDRIEQQQLPFFERVREGYLEIAARNQRRFLVLDGRLERSKLHTLIADRTQTALKEM
ncbi:MAG: dTMP kinase [Candidatus Delongbacteria bacterium]|nr:dTMP kinase [Candidatus Delongbacteria bacterium]